MKQFRSTAIYIYICINYKDRGLFKHVCMHGCMYGWADE